MKWVRQMAICLGINWLNEFCIFLMNICKDTREVVVKLHLQPQSKFLCLCMNTEWIETLGKCTSYLVMEALCSRQLLCVQLWDREVFSHPFCYIFLASANDWKLIYKRVLLKDFVIRVFLNYLLLMHIELVLNGNIYYFDELKLFQNWSCFSKQVQF